MSRSGYSDDCDYDWYAIMWRGAVASAIKGRRGQAFLKEMLQAMDALPEHKLIAEELEQDGAVCAIGTVGKARGINMRDIDPTDREAVAATFGISPALAAEIAFLNDDYGWTKETPESRFQRMREWIVSEIREPKVQS